MAPLAKSSTEAKKNTDNLSTDNHQSLATKIRNIIIMEDTKNMADDESRVNDVSDVVILLSRHSNNNKSGEPKPARELSNAETGIELNTDTHFQDDELDLSFAEKEQILNAISLLSRHRVPAVGRTQSSESGAVRTRRTRSLDLVEKSASSDAIEENTFDGEDEDMQLLISTFANILTLMSRRRTPQVPGRTKTSESGAARGRKTRSINLTPQSAATEAVEDEDMQLLTSTFANILTLMSRRRTPQIPGRTKTSEPGAARGRRTRSMDLLPEIGETEVEDEATSHDFDLWESSIVNILTLMSRRRTPQVPGRTKTSESGAVRIYRIN